MLARKEAELAKLKEENEELRLMIERLDCRRCEQFHEEDVVGFISVECDCPCHPQVTSLAVEDKK